MTPGIVEVSNALNALRAPLAKAGVSISARGGVLDMFEGNRCRGNESKIQAFCSSGFDCVLCIVSIAQRRRTSEH